ncbi:MAG: flagellar hook-associated protein FlgL [Planctomycetes bacterium]|nr:flagellar hook-associated protein FlgL [Planctomycetota bacterium]
MRITEQLRINRSLSDLTGAQRTSAKAEEQVASGKRINRPSDDPFGAGRAIRLRAELASITEASENVGIVRGELDVADDALQSLSELLARAREIAVQGANGINTPSDMTSLEEEAEGLMRRALSLVNVEAGGRYLFAGTDSGAPPFELEDVGGVITPRYHGDTQERVFGLHLSTVNGPPPGPEPFVSAGGRTGALDALVALRDALVANDPAATRASIDGLDEAINGTTETLARVGGRQADLSALEDGLAERRVILEQVRSSIEDADLSRAIVDLKEHQATYERSLQVLAGVLQVSILDFIGPL